jgi:uncharacterized membrane protein YebE (DUF533 family)
MKLSDGAKSIRQMIEKAIIYHMITRHEYDMIIYQATADGHIDSQEKALLSQLQEMIEDKTVRLVP